VSSTTERWLKVACFYFEGSNTLIVLDDCTASKDMKGHTGKLVKLGFSARHVGADLAALQHCSIAEKMWQHSCCLTPLQPTPQRPSSKNMQATFPKMTSSS